MSNLLWKFSGISYLGTLLVVGKSTGSYLRLIFQHFYRPFVKVDDSLVHGAHVQNTQFSELRNRSDQVEHDALLGRTVEVNILANYFLLRVSSFTPLGRGGNSA